MEPVTACRKRPREKSLNPCFNGIQMEQAERAIAAAEVVVLILVLMEYKWNLTLFGARILILCLNPCFNGIQMELINICREAGVEVS